MRGKNGFPLASLFYSVFFILLETRMSEAQPLGRIDAYWQKYLTGGAGPVEYGADAGCVDVQGNVFIAGNSEDDGIHSMRVVAAFLAKCLCRRQIYRSDECQR